MATAPPPIYQFLNINYNQDFFINNPTGYVTYAYVNANFLRSVGVALSTATITTFTGNVSIGGLLTLSGGLNLTGGLTVDTLQVNSTSSFIGQSTFTLIPILPTGYQFITTLAQSISGIKTFSSTLNTNGINDLVSITSPIITASTVCNSPYFNATNASFTTALYNTSITGTLTSTVSCSSAYFQATGATTSTFNNISATGIFNNQMFLGGSDLTFFQQFVAYPTTTISQSGTSLGWNANGLGETDFINLSQLGSGGFNFSNISSTTTNTLYAQIRAFGNNGLRIFPASGQLQVDDNTGGAFSTNMRQDGAFSVITSRGISTTLFLQCGDATAVPTNVFQVSNGGITPLVPLNPTSTTTFNAFHPTTTLGNNISTNTTQYATVGYVNANGGTSLLPLNNVWTGQNSFSQNYISVSSIPYRFGGSVGNVGSIILGDTSCLTAITSNTGNICVGFVSQLLTTGTNNISMGTRCLRDTTTGGQNTSIGYQCLTNVTTGSNNTCIGSSSGLTILTGNNNTFLGANASGLGQFSFSTALGTNSVVSASNQIMLGSSGDTVQCPNNINVSNNLTVTNNATINGMILQPILSFTTGVSNTFTTIPPYIIYTPAVGQGFILPPPSASNAGCRFVIRRAAAGSSSTIIFSCTGNPLVWVILNGTVGTASYAVASLGASQSEWFSSGTLFYQLI